MLMPLPSRYADLLRSTGGRLLFDLDECFAQPVDASGQPLPFQISGAQQAQAKAAISAPS